MEYQELAEIYEALESTTKRLDKTQQISLLLKKTELEDLNRTILLLQGKVSPPWNDQKLGVAEKLVIKAINKSTGFSTREAEKEYSKKGDLGLVAEEFVKKKKQITLFSHELTVKKVFDNFKKLPGTEGMGSVDRKIRLISELLTSAKPLEARYIVRGVLEQLRVGIGSGTLRDGVVWAYLPRIKGLKSLEKYYPEHQKKEVLKVKKAEDIENKDLTKYDTIEAPDDKTAREIYNIFVNKTQLAYDLTNDFSNVAKILKTKGLKGLDSLSLKVGNPLNAMLYIKAKDIQDGFKTVGKPAALEYKYDGFRLQIHKNKGGITLFTRRLENVTHQFPDVIEAIKKNVKGKEFILDAEVIGINKKTGKYLAFQNISQRIKRKYNIREIAKTIPVVVSVFDIMSYEGKTLINKEFEKRREIIEKIIIEEPEKLVKAKQLITESEEEAGKFYQEALEKGNEGIMMKNLSGIYKPGSRVGYGVKVKPVLESFDLVIVKAEYGKGKRAGWFTSFTIACREEDEVLEIGRVGTGIKEKKEEGLSFEELTELLKPLIINKTATEVEVKPEIIVDIDYEEIQKSPSYNSGYALRFPRVKSLRTDLSLEDITELELVQEVYDLQRGRK